jgi:hypothetical protein
MSDPNPPWYVTTATEALHEGFRVLAHELNEVLKDRKLDLRIAADPKQPDDDLGHALKKFRSALHALRAVRPLSPRDDSPWALGHINDDHQLFLVRVEGDWADALSRVIEFLRRVQWTPEKWRTNIVEPVERYHEERRQWLRSLAGPVAAAVADSDYVTLDKMAVIVKRSKKTLQRYLNDGRMPQPDIEGGGGRPHEWRWSAVRPWLNETFHRDLPEHFPGNRPDVP